LHEFDEGVAKPMNLDHQDRQVLSYRFECAQQGIDFRPFNIN
jgi:hypothetical protein